IRRLNVVESGSSHKALIAIKDPNLIYAGRPATPTPAPAGSKKSGGGAFAVPLDLKSEDAVPRAIRYAAFVTPDYTMITEMSGESTIKQRH
ncbi:MAG: hypothetical protein WAU91_01655, partial [Desulfatitalea sp.]